MPLDIRLVPCLDDNYAILIRDEESGEVAAVDTPEPGPILAELDRLGWRLTKILNTHKHGDHIGGNPLLRARTGAEVIGPAEIATSTHVDRIVKHGDTVKLGATELQVLDTGGHTHGHISYFAPDAKAAFVGDTLFALGCGRLFEGTPEQMWTSLSRLAALPADTLVYCAHEYTAANARFALSVDSSPELAARARAVFDARQRGEPTVPTTIGVEKATNPFLRAPLLRPDLEPTQAFAQIRGAKDNFRG